MHYSHSSPLDHLSSMEPRPLTGKYWAAATLLLLAAAALMLSTSCFASSIAKPSPPAPAATATANFSDHSVLLTFRSLITKDPFGALSSWGNKSLHFCRWQGVACGKHGRRRGRVVGLDLGSLGLVGTISPSISNLTYLRRLHMPMNQFSGHIPHELGLLGDLKHLNLSDNALGGEIPVDLSRCSKLQTISLWYNNLQGTIPANLSRCSALRTIELFANYLEGEIPSEIGTLQNLELLNLFDNGLNGSIPPELGNLKKLYWLDLSNNGLTGSIPAAIAKLHSLQYMDFGNNKLSGSVPASLSNLSSLSWLVLENNSLSGTIPPSFGDLSYLNTFSLAGNNLVGDIPPSLGNLSFLTELILKRNYLSGQIPHSLGNLYGLSTFSLGVNMLTGTIPPSFGNLLNLVYLGLQFNNLVGVIPPSLFNISSLQKLDMQNNRLGGILPDHFGDKFPHLRGLALNGNKFHGHIPLSLFNCSMLNIVQLDNNSFYGTIPSSVGNLKFLLKLRLDYNMLEANQAADWAFLDALTNCSHLQVLQLGFNRLSGVLPNSLSNLSNSLERLEILNNEIEGNIPEGIGGLTNLMTLYMGPNLLTGRIPSSLGTLSKLKVISLVENRLSGEIPPTLGNLTQLIELYLTGNELTGQIPPSLGKCSLGILSLDYNNLTGKIPNEVFLADTIIDLSFQNNMLVGPIPSELGLLKNMVVVDFMGNMLTGEIPVSIGGCQSLQYLYVRQNLLHGSIPSTMKKLTGLQELDLSSNNLSGTIPEFFSSFAGLTYLNLSFNNLIGEVPDAGIFHNATAFSIVGNDGLCGGIPALGLPPCLKQSAKKKKFPRLPVVVSVSTVLSLIFISFLIFQYGKHKSNKKQLDPVASSSQLPRVSYADLSRATDGFSTANLIGEGRFGSVYRGTMSLGEHSIVAVKILKLQERGASHSFLAECETLRYLRHRNLVKILTACSTIDPRQYDFKALVFEYLPNGNLDKWLHVNTGEHGGQQALNLCQRLSIVIDVGSAVEYLHDFKPKPVVHCDLKPSNILLDSDMVAHVGDFGLARFINQQDRNQSQSSGWTAFRGTLGYAAPEYGIGNEVTTCGDVYSYGILLLEMFTGRSPTEENFQAEFNLHSFVAAAFPNHVEVVADHNLIPSSEDTERDPNSLLNKEATLSCLASILRIGLICSKQLPAERMQMRDVVKELHKIKEKLYPLRSNEGTFESQIAERTQEQAH